MGECRGRPSATPQLGRPKVRETRSKVLLKPTVEQLTAQVAAAKTEQPAKIAAAEKAMQEAQTRAAP